MRATAAALAMLTAAAQAHAAPPQQPPSPAAQAEGQLMRLGWGTLVLHFSYAKADVSVRFERTLDPAMVPRLRTVIVSSGAQSYAIHDASLAQIRTDALADCWISLYVDAGGAQYISLFIPEGNGMLAEIAISAMKSHRILFRPL